MNIRPLYRLLKILTYAQDEKVTLNLKILPCKGTDLFSNQAAGREQIIIVFMLVLKLTANVN